MSSAYLGLLIFLPAILIPACANKDPFSQSNGFSSSHVWMWELDCEERWVPKNWCFWTVVLEKTLESPLDCKDINQSILKEISPGVSLEGMMLKLKLPYYGHLMRRVDSLEKSLTLGGIRAEGEGDDRGWDGWMASLTRWTWVWVNSGSWWWTGRPGVLRFMGSQRVGHDWVTELTSTEGTQSPGRINHSMMMLFVISYISKEWSSSMFKKIRI